jgi:hypothetical protein
MFVSMFIFVMFRHIVFSRKLRMTFRTIRRIARIKMICLSKCSLIYLQYLLDKTKHMKISHINVNIYDKNVNKKNNKKT